MNPTLPHVDYASHPAYGGMFEPDARLGEEARRTLAPLIEEMVQIERMKVAWFGSSPGFDTDIGREIAERGVSRLQLPGPMVRRLQAAAAPALAAAGERIEAARAAGQPITFKITQEAYGPKAHPDLWRACEEVLRETGLLQVAGRYFSLDGAAAHPHAKLVTAAVMVSRPGQSWSERVFRDAPVETPPTHGFHIDSNRKPMLKVVLYLNEVGPGQGPFGLIPGSHRWDEGSEGRIHRRAFDRSTLVSRSAASRRAFVSLPQAMQVKAEFGGDMLPGSPEAKALLENEESSIGPPGLLSLFDPEAIHRGGHAAVGERQVLLMSLAARIPAAAGG